MLLMQPTRLYDSRAAEIAGNSTLIIITMIVSVTSNSMMVM